MLICIFHVGILRWCVVHVCFRRMLDENFKDQMEEIVKLSPRGRQTMLFSATMTDEVNFDSW